MSDGQNDGHRSTVTDPLPPYVRAEQPMQVPALVRGELWDAWVLGWRGDRVYLKWTTEAGNHLGWAPVADVERVE